MRALLVCNPNATTTGRTTVDAVAGLLGTELKVDVAPTQHRGHAMVLAEDAVHGGYDAVLALGGDGTANEVLQGIAGTDVRLGVIPGGSTNVWARNLGLPNDAVGASAHLLRAVRDGSERRVSLGRANGRWFGVNAGFGFDAEVVRFVERRHQLKRVVRQAAFLWCGALAYATAYDRGSAIHATVEGRDLDVPLRSAVICNADPYTYLGRLPVRLCPEASDEAGLDLLGLTTMGLPSLARLARAALSSSADVRALPFTRCWHDRMDIDLRADRALPLQLDGELVGTTRQVRFEHVPRAVAVIA